MQLSLGDITVEVVLKNIKNMHLSVYPPTGRVRISAPKRMDLDTIRLFALSKLGWIRAQQHKVQAQPRETPREYLERESHYVWGKRYLLELHEHRAAPKVEISHKALELWVKPGTPLDTRAALLEGWYRDRLREAAGPLIATWQTKLNVEVENLVVRRMKTRWGSCTPARRSIRLNTDLAKKPPVCLEYVVVHELMHLLEPSHNSRFVSLMNQHLPNWRAYRDELNRLPVRHENWTV